MRAQSCSSVSFIEELDCVVLLHRTWCVYYIPIRVSAILPSVCPLICRRGGESMVARGEI